MAQDLPELLTVDELAQILRITPKAVRSRVKRDEIPGVVKPSPRTTLFRKPAILAWLAADPVEEEPTEGAA